MSLFIPNSWDYLVIGSAGFASFGEIDQRDKERVEMRIVKEYVQNRFPIPEIFKDVCAYSVKRFPYEEESYRELVIMYDRDTIESWDQKWESLPNEELQEKFDKFWDWCSEVECIDLENEELFERIKEEYLKECRENNEVPMSILRGKAI